MRIDRSGADIIVTVVENPVINQVAFEGNSEIDTETLRNEVQLKPRSVFTRARVQADVQRVLDVYRRQGRYAATIEPKIIELEQDRVNLVFEINEGAATKVKGIHFVGNHAFSDSQLRDVVSTTEKGWFDFLKGTAVYDPDRMNLDRELLRQYYLKNGYADVQVTAANAELDRDGSGFFITYSIEEGELYEFGGINIESTVAAIEPGKFKGDLLTDEGDTYNANLIDKSVEKLTLGGVGARAIAFARVRPQAMPDPVTRKISLNYVIEEGPRIYIERINITGNTRTKDYVIRREFKVAEGDAYNPLMVDQAKKRLTNLGLFKDVEVKRRPGSAQDRVVLDVELVEQSTGELSFGAGYSTAEGVIGDVSITERNLMGNGQFLRLQLSGSLERLQVEPQLHRAALPRPQPRGRLRPLPQGGRPDAASRASTAVVRAAACASASRCPRSCGCRPTTRSRATRSSTWSPGASLAIQERRGHVVHLAGRHDAHLRPAQRRQEPDQGSVVPGGHRLRRSRRRRAVRQLRGRSARLLPDHRQHHLRRPRHRRLDQRLGRRGRSPDRPVLQGR